MHGAGCCWCNGFIMLKSIVLDFGITVPLVVLLGSYCVPYHWLNPVSTFLFSSLSLVVSVPNSEAFLLCFRKYSKAA